MGGFKIQGRAPELAAAIRADARAVAEAGAYAVVLEGIPAQLAATIRDELPVPTIGIGAGAACDGQVLVCYDLLGLLPPPSPSFVRRYDDWWTRGIAAATAFREDVRAGRFPAAEQGG
jgi:3-methyl-2-oxobutanoate hydroxymethyltransferase